MKNYLFFGVVLVFLAVFGFVVADNETNNETNIDVNCSLEGESCEVLNCCENLTCEENVCILEVENETENNETEINETSCELDDDCEEGYICEENVCVLDDEDENETEVGKVCCKRTRLREGKSSWYNYIEKGDCVGSRGFNAEIVHDSMCKRFRYRFANETNETGCPQNCTCSGSTTKCFTEDGREMTVRAGNSGNFIVQVKNAEMKTNVELYKDEDGDLVGNFNGAVKKIKFLPDEIKEKVKAKLSSEVIEDEMEIELEEDGLYVVQAKKRARLFWIFNVREKVSADIDAETGQFVKLKNSWWGFLANDVEE